MAKEPTTPLKGGELVKSLMHFWQIALLNAGARCGVRTTRDGETAACRFEHEGLSFLTMTLPAFAKDLERGLDQGRLAPNAFTGFHRRRGLPVFLQGFLELVFDREDGCLLDEPSVEAILCLRQLTMLFGKLEAECTERRTRRAYANYVETDASVAASDEQRTESQKDDFRRISRMLFGPILADIEQSVYHGEIWPRHGSGMTADRLMGNQKFEQRDWTSKLERVFPFWEYARLGIVRSEFDLDDVHWHGPGAEVPAKVTHVPKTLKAPRLIAEEPTCNMYVQQGLSRELTRLIGGHQTIGQLIGFKDQEPNRFAAEWGSVFQDLATLDLSEASDRVSNRHVDLLLADSPLLREAFEACRSSKADVLGHGVLHLAKFASMGSALTFPVEAMVFLTVIFIAVEKHSIGRGELRHHLSMNDVMSYVDRVRVYGDDLIVPVEFAVPVTEELEAYGLKVNADKSFWTGKFRESCGGDYYDGEDVTPIRCKRVFPTSLDNAAEIASLVALRNGLYLRGWWTAVVWLDEKIRGLTPFPIVEPTSPLEGRTSVCFGYQARRTSRGTQSPLVRGARLDTIERKSTLDGTSALVKHFLRRSKEPYGKMHLERYGRSDYSRIKITWAQPF
jgi:hypothetical protein